MAFAFLHSLSPNPPRTSFLRFSEHFSGLSGLPSTLFHSLISSLFYDFPIFIKHLLGWSKRESEMEKEREKGRDRKTFSVWKILQIFTKFQPNNLLIGKSERFSSICSQFEWRKRSQSSRFSFWASLFPSLFFYFKTLLNGAGSSDFSFQLLMALPSRNRVEFIAFRYFEGLARELMRFDRSQLKINHRY